MEILVIAALLGLIPAAIAKSKGRSFGLWWFFGAALFIVALPIALLMQPDQATLELQQLAEGMKKCPHCAEMIKADAKVCRYCGRDLPALDGAPQVNDSDEQAFHHWLDAQIPPIVNPTAGDLAELRKSFEWNRRNLQG